MVEAAAAFKVVELGREVPGLHAVATPSEAGPTGLQLVGDLLEFMLEVTESCLLFVVSYDLSVCHPVG